MVCFYGPTLMRLDKSLTDKQRNDYPLWSWLVYNLAEFIYIFDGGQYEPYMPIDDDDSSYAHWFKHAVLALDERFTDATPERVFKCIQHCPTEEVASLIYDATSLNLQRRFMESLIPRLKKEAFPKEYNIPNLMENPAKDPAKEADDMPPPEDIPDDLPPLENILDDLPPLENIPDEDNYEKDIEIVMEYKNCSRKDAIKKLEKHEGDVLLTIYDE